MRTSIIYEVPVSGEVLGRSVKASCGRLPPTRVRGAASASPVSEGKSGVQDIPEQAHSHNGPHPRFQDPTLSLRDPHFKIGDLSRLGIQ